MDIKTRIRLGIAKVLFKLNKNKYSKFTLVNDKNGEIHVYSTDNRVLYSLARVGNDDFYIVIKNTPWYAPPNIFDLASSTDIGKDFCKKVGIDSFYLKNIMFIMSFFKGKFDCTLLWTTKEGIRISSCNIPDSFKENSQFYLKYLMSNVPCSSGEIIKYSEVKKAFNIVDAGVF